MQIIMPDYFKQICILILVFQLNFFSSFTQENTAGIDVSIRDTSNLFITDIGLAGKGLVKKPIPKFDFDMTVGSNILLGGRSGSVFNNYLSPNVRYQPGSKFNFSVGSFIMLSNMPNYFGSSIGEGEGRHSLSSSYIYGSGNYMVNDKLRVYGSVMYELSPFKNYSEAYNNNISVNDQLYSIGMDYNISNNFKIGFQLSHMKTDNPFLLYNTYPFGRGSSFRPIFDF